MIDRLRVFNGRGNTTFVSAELFWQLDWHCAGLAAGRITAIVCGGISSNTPLGISSASGPLHLGGRIFSLSEFLSSPQIHGIEPLVLGRVRHSHGAPAPCEDDEVQTSSVSSRCILVRRD